MYVADVWIVYVYKYDFDLTSIYRFPTYHTQNVNTLLEKVIVLLYRK